MPTHPLSLRKMASITARRNRQDCSKLFKRYNRAIHPPSHRVYLPSSSVQNYRSKDKGRVALVHACAEEFIKHGGEVGWFEERGAVEPGEDRSNLPATSAGAAIYSQQDIGTGVGKEWTQVNKSWAFLLTPRSVGTSVLYIIESRGGVVLLLYYVRCSAHSEWPSGLQLKYRSLNLHAILHFTCLKLMVCSVHSWFIYSEVLDRVDI